MAAVLIFTMGSVVLLSLSAAATRINREVAEADKFNQTQIFAVEQAAGSGVPDKVYFTLTQKDSDGKVGVEEYIGETDVYLYQYTPQPGDKGALRDKDALFYTYFKHQGGANG